MKLSLSEAPSGCHLSPSTGEFCHFIDVSEDSGMSVASSTVKSVKGTDSALLVPLVESLGILFTLQFTDPSPVSSIALDSASPGFLQRGKLTSLGRPCNRKPTKPAISPAPF